MDYGTDPLLSTLYAKERQNAHEGLRPDKCTWVDGMKQRKQWRDQTLAELRDKAVTPAMLVAAGCKWHDLQKKHGAQALIDYGMQWPDMVACGFTGADIRALSFSQMRALGLTAHRLLECRPTPENLSAARLSVAQLKELGWTAEELRALGINMKNMICFGYPVETWQTALGIDKFDELGFTSYAECARVGWTQSDIAMALESKVVADRQSPVASVYSAPRGAIKFI